MTPKHTRESINRIGKLLVADDLTPEQRGEMLDRFNDWRALHLEPINAFQVTLRKYVKEIDAENGIVAQRLKRRPTIIDKLKNRHQSMKLGQLQDVGGLRAIVSDVGKVRILEKKYDKSRAKHKLLRKYDYIAHPKESGYRGIHLVYSYVNANKPDSDGLFIEVQLRTRLQHLWATAVETVGTFNRESLKSSQGSPIWLEFFKIVSALFSCEEKEQPHEDYRDLSYQQLLELFKNFVDENKIFASLDIIQTAASPNWLPRAFRDVSEYWVMALDPKEQQIMIDPILPENSKRKGAIETMDRARKSYAYCEEKFEQVVLVSVDSVQKIERAYPNFFLNILEFRVELNRLYKSQKLLKMPKVRINLEENQQ